MIVTAVDDKFLSEASPLVKSCARHAPEQRFYLFLVNSVEERVAALRACHPRLIVEHVRWPYDAARWRGLMCSARSAPILHVLETYREPTLYLDSDVLLMRPLDELFARLESCDMLVKYRPDCEVRGAAGTTKAAVFNSGVIALRPTDVAVDFAREYDRRIRAWIESGRPLCKTDERRNINTCIDQEFLYLVYEDFKDRLTFAPLADKFNDASFAPTSVIWHGKGTARKHPQYVQAKLSYGPRSRYYAFAVIATPLRLAYRCARLLRARRRAR